jgi:lipopolysaccharide export system permease protein
MTLLDRYIIRQFFLTFVFGLIAFLLIFLVVDLMEKLDDFIDARVETAVIFEYYLHFMPEIIKLMMPVAMLLAALFVTGRLANQNELAAMKSSGMSLYRFLVPFAGVALLVSLGGIYFNGWIVPVANQKKFAIERQHLQRVSSSTSRFNVFFQEGRTRLVSIGFYDNNSKLANRVSIQDYADTNLTVLVRRLDAQQMQWQSFDPEKRDSAEPGWVLLNGTHRLFNATGHVLETFDRFPVGRLSLGPDDIEKKQQKPDEMDFGELWEFIESQRRAGQDVSRWLVDYHSKIAFPFASLIVVLFGVPFSSNKRRSGVAIEFGISIAATFIYLGFMKTSQVFGYNGDLNPFLTAWLANILFLSAGIVNLARVQK